MMLRRALSWGALLAVSAASALMLIAWSGIYNVAASRGHWPMV
ncbi:MAG: cytochrome C, partial [Rhodospirillaceae bacterium]|nr:cytochrome C [Rhodospirillaceae bacterium]